MVTASIVLTALLGATSTTTSSTAESSIISTAGRLLCKYQPSYFTFVNFYDDQAKEAFADTVKFQISVRYALWVRDLGSFDCAEPQEAAIFGRIMPWFGFTQKSIWQLYASGSPFEESNYKPEVFLTWYQGWGPLVRTNFGLLEHESNGTAGSRSRSWNRAYVEAKLKWKAGRTGPSVTLYPRVWVVPDIQLGMNTDIADYLGYGKLIAVLSTGETFAGRIQLEVEAHKGGYPWSTPFRGGFLAGLTWAPGKAIDSEYVTWWKATPHFYAQFFHGYGETLLRYNQVRTSVWFGLRITD